MKKAIAFLLLCLSVLFGASGCNNRKNDTAQKTTVIDREASEQTERQSELASDGEKVSEKASEAGEKISEKIDEAGDKISEKASEARN